MEVLIPAKKKINFLFLNIQNQECKIASAVICKQYRIKEKLTECEMETRKEY